jgi:uncharacterized phiE125 gp8 family phage protein
LITLALVTPPGQEPITLQQAKFQLCLDASYITDDALVTLYIQAAREYVESNCNRAVLSQQWRFSLDGFPVYTPGRIRFNDRSSYRQIANQWAESVYIYLPKPSLISVDSIKWIDTAGIVQTLNASAYSVDADSIPARIAPTPNTYWPVPQMYCPNTVQIVFTCGYGSDPLEVPARIQAAMLLLIAHWYANRESVSSAILTSIPFGIDALLASERFDTFVLGN